jgi:hypothetical protein
MRESIIPEEIAAAETRRRLDRDALWAREEFEKLGWSEWRLFSWIAYGKPSLICRIEHRRDLGALRRDHQWHRYHDFATLQHRAFVATSLRDRRPDHTALRLLQEDKIKALRDGKEIPRDYWLDKEPSDIRNVTFRREDVLRLVPGSGSAESAPLAVPPITEHAPLNENQTRRITDIVGSTEFEATETVVAEVVALAAVVDRAVTVPAPAPMLLAIAIHEISEVRGLTPANRKWLTLCAAVREFAGVGPHDYGWGDRTIQNKWRDMRRTGEVRGWKKEKDES